MLFSQAFGFILRKAPVKKLPRAVAAVVSEGVATSALERVHGAAQVLAVSIHGPSCTLHSRAEPLLAALFSMASLKSDIGQQIPGTLLPHADGSVGERWGVGRW
jgi:hypothetical protein